MGRRYPGTARVQRSASHGSLPHPPSLLTSPSGEKCAVRHNTLRGEALVAHVSLLRAEGKLTCGGSARCMYVWVEACVRHGRELKCSGCGVTLGLEDADDVARAMREVRPDLLCSVLARPSRFSRPSPYGQGAECQRFTQCVSRVHSHARYLLCGSSRS